ENVRKMGELFAALHLHAGSWEAPAEFPSKKFDAYLSRGEPEVLFDEECVAAYAPEDLEVVHQADARVAQTYAALAPGDLRVIHCDLWHENIKLYKGELLPFDFEDTILGYRLHDIAMAMLDLAETVGSARYEHLHAAFRRGYEAHLPFPEGDMLALQMGRVLWKINWFARFAKEHFATAAAFHAGVLRRALQSGRLVDPLSPT
ncbi:MAG: phosphotransferase, partial [Gammaproteobacteria bacterium]